MAKNRQAAEDEFIIIPPSLPLTKRNPQPPSQVISPRTAPQPKSTTNKRPSLKPKNRDANVSTIDELESLIRNAKPNFIEDRVAPEPIYQPETPTDNQVGELDALAIDHPVVTDEYQRLFTRDGSLGTLKIDVSTDKIDASPSTAQAVSLIFTYPGNIPQQFNSSYSMFLSSLKLKVQGSRYEKGLLECILIMYNDQIIAEWDLTDVYQTIAKKYDGESKIRVEYADEEHVMAEISLPLCYSWTTNGCSVPFINDGSFVMLVKWSDMATDISYSLHASMSICNTPRYPKIVDCKRLVYLDSSLKLPFEFQSDCFVHDVFIKCDNKIEYLGLYKDGICLQGKAPESYSNAQTYDDEDKIENIYQLTCSNDGKPFNLKGCNISLMSVELNSDEEHIRYDVYALVETGVTIH
uniref:Uncharacterized protein n=1 Tax=Clandestinovirus TaxID=2831644 RepID=A0A8F8KP25_9VIRU|nr:hypothetical protein KOM_12_418 [Clandestinovirus]